MSGAKRFVEQRVVKRRDEEARNGELRRKLTEHNLLAGHGSSAVRVEAKRRARSEAAERREMFMDYSHVQTEQERHRKVQISAFEEHLADELSRRKAMLHRDEMDKKRICDGSEELRALKERLHIAKVSRERAQQLMHNHVRSEQDKLREHHIAEHMENERLEHIELEHKLNIEKAKQRERVKSINQQQICMKEAQRQEAQDEYNREKHQVNCLVDKIVQEDQVEADCREEKKEETRQALRRFMVEQKAQQEAMERAECDELEAIEKYAADKRAREESLEAEKKAVEAEKKRVFGAILGDMEAKSKEKEVLDQLRNDLHFQELEEESRRREEVQARKKLEDREDMKNAYVFQMRAKEEKAAKFQQEEAKLRDQLMKKFGEDDRIEQMNEHKRRMKVELHKREADRLVQHRRDMYDQQREAERHHDSNLAEDEKKRAVVIESERQRLLMEHASELADFLPKGTLENKDDHKFLRRSASVA